MSIQIGQPVGRITVRGGVHTEGGTGDSLVRGAIVRVSAHALSIQPGGRGFGPGIGPGGRGFGPQGPGAPPTFPSGRGRQ